MVKQGRIRYNDSICRHKKENIKKIMSEYISFLKNGSISGGKRVICIGSACKDIFFPTAEGKIIKTPGDLLSQEKIQFELGAKYKVEERYETLGGCAANVASGLSKLELDVSCYSHIGNDDVADWIVGELEKNNVDINLVARDEKEISDLSAIIVDKKSGDRVIFSNQKANAQLKIVPDQILSAEWFFIGDLHGGWEEHLDAIIETAQEKKIKVAYNPRQANIHDNVEKVIQVASFSEVLFVNKDEAIEIASRMEKEFSKTDLNSEEFLLKELKKLEAAVIVITDGKRGAWATDGEKIVFAEGLVVPAVDSTGAGDAYSSGFLAGYINGRELSECLQWGIVNSASVVQFFGGTGGLLGEKDIVKQAESIKAEEK